MNAKWKNATLGVCVTAGVVVTLFDAARRRPDPVALGHAAGELAVAEKVSGKKASLTAKAVLAEAADLARLRRQVAELKATAALQQQIASEEADAKYWDKQIAPAEATAQREKEAALAKEPPPLPPRKVIVNNDTTQYVDLNVNGFLKLQIPPGTSRWCAIEHRWDPTVLTAWGDEDQGVWGPRQIWGDFATYTWNLE